MLCLIRNVSQAFCFHTRSCLNSSFKYALIYYDSVILSSGLIHFYKTLRGSGTNLYIVVIVLEIFYNLPIF